MIKAGFPYENVVTGNSYFHYRDWVWVKVSKLFFPVSSTFDKQFQIKPPYFLAKPFVIFCRDSFFLWLKYSSNNCDPTTVTFSSKSIVSMSIGKMSLSLSASLTLGKILVLYTVGLCATFWNMFGLWTVWTVWTSQGSKEQNQLKFFLATFEGGFFNFSDGKKIYIYFLKYCSIHTKRCLS